LNAWSFGETIEGLTATGLPVRAAVFDEHAVRAAAGLTLALGAVAFADAWFVKVYAPFQAVTVLFAVEFLLRLLGGSSSSAVGVVARWLARRQRPQWVSAKPKRVAWSLGLAMSLAMSTITNVGIRGALPLAICLICMTLMWLEAVLGLCLGCETHGLLVRRGWIARDQAFEVCSNGACAPVVRGASP
jgi:Domain of unknown function (DUF4395)